MAITPRYTREQQERINQAKAEAVKRGEKYVTKERAIGWQVTIRRVDPATGERKRVIVGSYRLKKEAERAEAEALRSRDRGELVDPSKITVGELLDDWLGSKRGAISDNSIADYRSAITLHLKPAIGHVRVQALTADTVQRMYNGWRDAERPLGERLIGRCHSVLHQALAQAVKRHTVVANVLDAVEKPKIGRTTVATWTPDQVRTFLATAQARPVLGRGGDTGRREPDDLHPLWHLLVLEGMRRGEALGLRWKDVDLDTGKASIQQTVAPDKNAHGAAVILPRTKTASGTRSVRLTSTTVDALREHRRRQLERRLAAAEWDDNDLIVCTRTGRPVNPNNVSRSFAALVKASGLPPIRVHDLRHTSATLLLRAGEHPKVVSERLGHADVSITLGLYSHVTPDLQDAAAAKLDALMGAATGTDGKPAESEG